MMLSMARHQERALADPRLIGNPLALHAELERYLRMEHPDLQNITVSSAKKTEQRRGVNQWFDVTFTADDPRP
jgi:hypothetical protein